MGVRNARVGPGARGVTIVTAAPDAHMVSSHQSSRSAVGAILVEMIPWPASHIILARSSPPPRRCLSRWSPSRRPRTRQMSAPPCKCARIAARTAFITRTAPTPSSMSTTARTASSKSSAQIARAIALLRVHARAGRRGAAPRAIQREPMGLISTRPWRPSAARTNASTKFTPHRPPRKPRGGFGGNGA